MRARLLSTRAVVLLLLIVLVSACRAGGGEPQPSTPPPPDPANPEPVTLAIERTELASMDNAEILVGTVPSPDEATAKAAVEATRGALERYLNAQFVDPDTRFTPEPARALLQPGIFDMLPAEQKAALGAGHLTVEGVLPRRALGTATVLFESGRAYAVTIDYTLEIDVFLPVAEPTESEHGSPSEEPAVARHPLTQKGTVLFTAPNWAVESFELRVEGTAVPSPTPPPAPPPSESAPTGEASP